MTKRSAVAGLLTIGFASLAVAANPAGAEAKFCVQGRPSGEGFPFFANVSHQGQTQATIYVNNDARNQDYFPLEQITAATEEWEDECEGSEEAPKLIPSFIPDFFNTRPPVEDHGDPEYGRSIEVRYLPEEIAPHDDDLSKTFVARWNATDNTIDVYGRCPTNPNHIGGIPCVNGTETKIDFRIGNYLEILLTHEIGHALGLGHDREGSCIGPGIMETTVEAGQNIVIPATYCSTVDDLNDHDAPCHAENEAAPDHTSPCEPLTPQETGEDPRAEHRTSGPGGNLCVRVPSACERPVGPGFPHVYCDWECVTVEDEDGNTLSGHCRWRCDGLAVNSGGDSAYGLGPRLGLQAPEAGSTVHGVVTLSGFAVDLEGIVDVHVSIDGEPIAVTALSLGLYNPAACQPPEGWAHHSCRTNSGFSATIDVSSVPDGLHDLQIVVRDGGQWSTDIAVPIIVNNALCADPPSAFITSPANGATVSGTKQVNVTASHATGIERVNFNVDWVFQASDHSSPYSFSWNTTNLADGTHVLRVRAYDQCGQNTVSAPITVTVQNGPPPNDPPAVNIHWPASGQIISGASVTLEGWAVDETGITNLSFQLDGVPLTLNSPHTWYSRPDICDDPIGQGDPRCPNVGWRGFFNSTAFADGAHTLKVTANDGSATTSTTRTFTIKNQPAGVTATFSPTHDAFIEQDLPNTPNGSSPQLSVRHVSLGQGRYSFLKFNVTGLTGPVTSAKLVLTETAGIDIPLLLVWEVFNNNWSESTVTWNTLPTPYELRSVLYNLAKNTTYEIDVTESVDGNGEVTIGLSNNQTEQDLFFGSKENGTASKRPKLKVTYQP